MKIQKQHCQNFNHRRMNVPVRCCPTCGKVVNDKILSRFCSLETHAKQRKNRNIYCVDCGEQVRGQAQSPHLQIPPITFLDRRFELHSLHEIGTGGQVAAAPVWQNTTAVFSPSV